MAEIEVLKLHMKNVVVIGNLNVVLVIFGRCFACIRVCHRIAAGPCFSSVPDLNFFRRCDDVLLVKQHSERSLYISKRKLTAVKSRQN